MYDCQLSTISFITPFCRVEEWTREIRIVPRTRIQEFFVFYVSLRIVPSFSIEITRRIGKNEIFNLHVHYAHRSSSRQKVQRINSFDASIYISIYIAPLSFSYCYFLQNDDTSKQYVEINKKNDSFCPRTPLT